MSHIMPRCWCDIILNMHATTEERSEDIRNYNMYWLIPYVPLKSLLQ